MLYIQYIRGFALVITLIVLASQILPVLADCIATPNGDGSDYHCTDTTNAVTGSPGSDMIINDGTITTYMWSGGFSENTTQQDTLINNGVVGSGNDDDGMWGGGGSDTIINHGTVYGGHWAIWEGVNGAIFGDDSTGIDDKDIITHNGVAHGNIHGDYSAGGDDIITINGQVNGGVYGDGPTTGHVYPFGNDTIILKNNAVVTTIIDGMGGTDTLRFEFSTTDEAVYNALSNAIAAADPAGGSLTFNGHTFTWVNFESLENSVAWIQIPTVTPTFTATATHTPTHTLTPTPTLTETLTPVPTLITPTSPADAAPVRHFSAGEPIVLTWNMVTWAQGYVIEIDDDANFSSPLIRAEVDASVQRYTLPVLGNGVYYWRIQARQNASTPGSWGRAETFSISAPVTPTP